MLSLPPDGGNPSNFRSRGWPPMADRTAASRESTSTTLLDLARQGDQAAWRRLAHLYLPLLLFWCRSLKGLNDQDAEDVVQEVLVAVFSALGKFQRQGRGAFRAWLRRITYNKAEDLRRQQQRQGQLVYLPEADLERMAVVDPEGEEESVSSPPVAGRVPAQNLASLHSGQIRRPLRHRSGPVAGYASWGGASGRLPAHAPVADAVGR